MSNKSYLFPQYCSLMTKLKEPDRPQIVKYATPFLIELIDISVGFNPFDRGSDEFKKAIESHFDNLLKDARTNKRDVTDVDWMKVNKRLSRPQSPKRNRNITLAFRIENAYLTNKYFTFGLMRPNPGFCHVYQTGPKPLLFYLQKPSSKPFLEKTFNCLDRSEFDCFILDPKSEYLIKDNVHYLILTIDKSFFGVGILSMSDVEHWNYKDPTENPFKQSTTQSRNSMLQGYATFNHSRQKNPNLQSSMQSTSKTSQAFQETDPDYLRTANPSRGQPPDNNMTMPPMQNSLEDLFNQPTSQRKGVARSATNGEETQSKKLKCESVLEEVNVNSHRQSQQCCSSTKQAARQENTRHSPSHSKGHLIYSSPEKSSDRYTPTTNNTRQQNTSESPNSSNLRSNFQNRPVLSNSTEEDETSSPNGDMPSSYEEQDDWGNTYEYIPIDMNWSVNENGPLTKMPIMKYINGRYYTFVPKKK